MGLGTLPIFREDGTLRADFVYCMFCETPDGTLFVKIGRTMNPGSRMAGLRTGSPLRPQLFQFAECINRSQSDQLEKTLHTIFQARRTNGEWFVFDGKKKEDSIEFKAGLNAAGLHLGLPNLRWVSVDVKALDAYQRQVRTASYLKIKARRDQRRRQKTSKT